MLEKGPGICCTATNHVPLQHIRRFVIVSIRRGFEGSYSATFLPKEGSIFRNGITTKLGMVQIMTQIKKCW